jgi:hypothetical protein
MKTFGQALAIGVLAVTFAGCGDDDNGDTINVQTTPDGGLPDAMQSSDGSDIHCRSFGKLGVHCFPGPDGGEPI